MNWTKNWTKKADISIQVIVIAIIALIVLVVLVLIFTGKITSFSTGVSSCADKGGVCVPDAQSCIREGKSAVRGLCTKAEGGTYCCIPVEN